MCGLVGVMGNTITEDVKKAFHDMLYLDGVRGDDSTGVAAISNAFNNLTEVELFKSTGGAAELFYEHTSSKRARTLTNKLVNIYMGHNRYATQGLVNVDNAHPFNFENVVGAHNGTVSLQSIKSFHGWLDFDVDSQIIFSHLSHTQDIREVWKTADGALALTWYNKVRKKLHFIRNKERPLYYAYTEGDKQVFWASERWMIVVAAMRHGIKIQDVVEVKPDTLFTFNTEAFKVRHTEEEVPPFVAKVNYYLGSRGGYGWMDDDEYWKKPEQNDYTKPPKKDPVSPTPFIITEFADDPKGPWALGYDATGKSIRVNIPVNRYADARGRLIGIKEQGFFSAKKLHKVVHNAGYDFFCNWADCNFIKLKPQTKIIRFPDNTFVFKPVDDVAHSYAPTSDDNVFLTFPSFVQKTKCGCLNCKKEPLWAERTKIRWIDNETFLCDECQELPFIKELINEAK